MNLDKIVRAICEWAMKHQHTFVFLISVMFLCVLATLFATCDGGVHKAVAQDCSESMLQTSGRLNDIIMTFEVCHDTELTVLPFGETLLNFRTTPPACGAVAQFYVWEFRVITYADSLTGIYIPPNLRSTFGARCYAAHIDTSGQNPDVGSPSDWGYWDEFSHPLWVDLEFGESWCQ